MSTEAFDEQTIESHNPRAQDASPELVDQTEPDMAVDTDLIQRLHERYSQHMPRLHRKLEELLGMTIEDFNRTGKQCFQVFTDAIAKEAQAVTHQRLQRPDGQTLALDQLTDQQLAKTKLREQTSWAHRHLRETLLANQVPGWVLEQWPEDEEDVPVLLQRVSHTLERLRQRIRLETGPFEVMLHGPGSSGKSSLINAMCGTLDWDRFPLAWARMMADECAIGHFPHTVFPVTDNVGNLPLFYGIGGSKPDSDRYRPISYNPFLEHGLCDNSGLHTTCLPANIERKISTLKSQFGVRYYVAVDDRLDKISIEISNTAEQVKRNFLLEQISLIDTAGVSEKQLANSDYFTHALYPRVPNDRVDNLKKADFLLYVGKLISNQQEEVVEQQRWIYMDSKQVHKRHNWDGCPGVLRNFFAHTALYVLNQADIFVADTRQVKRELSPNNPGDRQTIKKFRDALPYVLASPYTFMTLGSDQIQGFRTFCEGGTLTNAGRASACEGFGQHDDGAGGILTIWAALGKAYLKPLQAFTDIASSSAQSDWVGLRCKRIRALQHWHTLLMQALQDTLQPVEDWRQDRVLLELIEEVMYLGLHRHYFHGDGIPQFLDNDFADFAGVSEHDQGITGWIKRQWSHRTGYPLEDIPTLAPADRTRLGKALAFVAMDRDRTETMLFDPSVPRHNDIFPPVWVWEERLEQHQRKTKRGRELAC